MNPISVGNTEHVSLLASAGLGRLYEGEEKKLVWLRTLWITITNMLEDVYMKYVALGRNNHVI